MLPMKKSNDFFTFLICLILCITMILVLPVISYTGLEAFAAKQFTVESNTKIASNEPIKLKLVASANGEIKAKKTGVISDPSSGIISVPFSFKKKNDIVTAGFHDEYFACGYIINSKTGNLISYICDEGDLQNPDGINSASLESFQAVPQGQNNDAKNVKINVLVPLTDKTNVHKIKVITMVKGEFQAKVIDAKNANGKTLSVMFAFDRETDIGKIQEGDEFFACVSANELNPPEGTECEKRHIKSFEEPNVLAAR